MYEVTMPKLSDSMEEGKIIEWKVKEGDAVKEGQVIAEVESDKAVMELECFQDGVLAKINKGDGAEVAVGEVIALIDAEGLDAEGATAEGRGRREREGETRRGRQAARSREARETARGRQAGTQDRAREEGAQGRAAQARRSTRTRTRRNSRRSCSDGTAVRACARGQPRDAAKPDLVHPSSFTLHPSGERVPISPYAKKLAADLGLDYSQLRGSGEGGRIVAADVEQAAKLLKPAAPRPEPPARKPSPDEELPALDLEPGEAEIEDASFRLKTQARRVTNAKHVIPHFYLTRGADVTALLARKDELKAKHGATITHLIMLACIRAIEQNPAVNRSYDRGKIIKWNGINLGLAVATDDGLTVAVLRNAGALSFADLVARSKDLVERAAAGKLSAAERRHPGLTITNLGMFDVEHFEPIINPPSSITLGVASALPDTIVRNGEIFIGHTMKLTASCDHRIVDGVTGAKFVASLVALLERPDELLEMIRERVDILVVGKELRPNSPSPT